MPSTEVCSVNQEINKSWSLSAENDPPLGDTFNPGRAMKEQSDGGDNDDEMMMMMMMMMIEATVTIPSIYKKFTKC